MHFAVAGNPAVSVPQEGVLDFSMRDVFDVPDLATTNDDIVNGTRLTNPDGSFPLAPFTAQRVDYSLARLTHYTATDPAHFQNHVLFTNYQFYVDEFEAFAREALADRRLGYTAFVAPGNQEIDTAGCADRAADEDAADAGLSPEAGRWAGDHAGQHRRRPVERQDRDRPYRRAAPPCLADGGPLRGAAEHQSLGDFVLAHAYVREDHVLDDDLPVWVPIPALAEIQIALQQAVAEVTQLEGYELKRIMRTGTVATIDNRNWELRDQSGPGAAAEPVAAPSRWTWKAPPSRRTGSGSGCPTARCSASPTSRCMAS